MKTTKELLAEYNKLTGKNLTAWKQSREKLIEKVNLLTEAVELTPQEVKELDAVCEKITPVGHFAIDALNYYPQEGEKIGAFMQRLLLTAGLTTKELIEVGKTSFPKSKISASDIAWHRAYLKRLGTPTELVRVNKKGERYTKINTKG